MKGIKNTGLFEVESVATADLDKEVVVSYAAIHCGLTKELIESYENYPDKEEMVKQLTDKRLGYDFKNDKPYDWEKLSRKKDKTKGIEKYWLADHISHNLGDMTQIKSLPYSDLLTYSCPCTDISISGKQEGLKWTCQDCGHEYAPSDLDVDTRYTCPNCGSHNIKSTRSGLLYEVERLLVKAKENHTLPKYLLMENVDALVSKKYINSFNDWLERLDNLGYNSYYQVINAKNTGIPQNRKRIFVFSILKSIDTGKFVFPTPFDNGIRLRDVLEETVDERYYLSDEKVASFLRNFIQSEEENAVCIKQVTNEVRQIGNIIEGQPKWDNPQTGRIYSVAGCSPTLNTCGGGGHEPKIMQVGSVSSSQDGIVVDPKGIAKSITAGHFNCPKVILGVDKSQNSPQIIERANCITAREDRGISNHRAKDTAVIEKIGNINPSGKGMNGNVFGENGLAPTLTTNKGEGPKIATYSLNGYPLHTDENGNIKTIVAMRGRNPENPSDRTVGAPTEQRLEVNTNEISNCLTTVQKDNLVMEGELLLPYIRIRKLTPKECHRLMGFDDIDVDRCKAVAMSDAQGYKQAGNSIVTNVIALITEHFYKAQYDEKYECLDEKMTVQKK